MTKSMDLDGNHKMDWFFNQCVYGTGMLQYSLHINLSATPDGETAITGELVRTGVPDGWKDVVPIYAHSGDKTFRIGSIAATNPTEPLEFVFPGKLDKLTINEYEDLPADVKQ